MKLFLNVVISILLLFNGIGALYGGLNLIMHPDGSSLQIDLAYLKYSPFTSYFIPGLILLVANGFFSLFVFLMQQLQTKVFPWLVIAQGIILVAYIVVQILMIKTIIGLHMVMGIVGLLLIICGWDLNKLNLKKVF